MVRVGSAIHPLPVSMARVRLLSHQQGTSALLMGSGWGGWEVSMVVSLLWAVSCQIPKKMSVARVYFHFPFTPAPSNHNKLINIFLRCNLMGSLNGFFSVPPSNIGEIGRNKKSWRIISTSCFQQKRFEISFLSLEVTSITGNALKS